MKRPAWTVAAHYAVLLLALLCVAPIVVIFATSLRQQVDIFAAPLNFLFTPTLENYRAVLEEDKFDRHLGNSLFVGIVSTVVTLVLGCMAAYGPAAAIDGCGPLRVFTEVLMPLLAPGIAAASIFTFRLAWNEFILALVRPAWASVSFLQDRSRTGACPRQEDCAP